MIVMPVMPVVPVLLSVSVCAALVVPTATLPNASGPPVTFAVDAAVTPVPESPPGGPLIATLLVIVEVPVTAPVAVGWYTMVNVQVLAAASVVPQVPPT